MTNMKNHLTSLPTNGLFYQVSLIYHNCIQQSNTEYIYKEVEL